MFVLTWGIYMAKKMRDIFAALLVTVIASVLLILLSVAYFMITVFVIKWGAALGGYSDIAGNTVVLTAGIITAAALVGSAIQQ